MAALQIIKFRAREGVSPETVVETNARFTAEVVPSMVGLERREVGVTDDGEWTLVLRYQERAQVGAPPATESMDVAGQFMGLIDMSTMSMSIVDLVD